MEARYTLKKSGNVSNRINAFDENGNKLFVIENGYSEDALADRQILGIISAAPDLLAFAIDFVEKVESGRTKSTDSYNKAKAAIAKATTI